MLVLVLGLCVHVLTLVEGRFVISFDQKSNLEDDFCFQQLRLYEEGLSRERDVSDEVLTGETSIVPNRGVNNIEISHRKTNRGVNNIEISHRKTNSYEKKSVSGLRRSAELSDVSDEKTSSAEERSKTASNAAKRMTLIPNLHHRPWSPDLHPCPSLTPACDTCSRYGDFCGTKTDEVQQEAIRTDSTQIFAKISNVTHLSLAKRMIIISAVNNTTNTNTITTTTTTTTQNTTKTIINSKSSHVTLLDPMTSLTCLALNSWRVLHAGNPRDAAAARTEFLRYVLSIPTLRHFSASNCNIQGVVLGSNTALEKLDLSRNHFGPLLDLSDFCVLGNLTELNQADSGVKRVKLTCPIAKLLKLDLSANKLSYAGLCNVEYSPLFKSTGIKQSKHATFSGPTTTRPPKSTTITEEMWNNKDSKSPSKPSETTARYTHGSVQSRDTRSSFTDSTRVFGKHISPLLPALQTLNLSGNLLVLDDDFSDCLPELRVLDISGNRLKYSFAQVSPLVSKHTSKIFSVQRSFNKRAYNSQA
jgi:hypothetical protein